MNDCKRCENTGEINIYDGVGFPYASWCPSCHPELAAKHRAEKAKELAKLRGLLEKK